ncbi:MAG: Xaa-Pro peptidase family protein [Planctomycetaceae bacterium]|nr:Xaa-Pro peptidase family protein [Planctomycetaceae bacterium]
MSRFHQRRSRLRQALKSQGVSALLITNFTNVAYLTGFTGDDSYLLLHASGEVLLSDTRYELQIAEECPGLDARIRHTSASLFEMAAKDIAKIGGNKCLGVESNTLTLKQRDSLAAKLPQWTIRGIEDSVESLRMIKDKHEIESIRKAIQAAVKGFGMIRSGLKPEQTEIEIRNDLEYAMRRFGAEDKSFNSIVAVGERAALPHAVPTSKRVEESELLLVDWGAKCEGYVSDLTRTLMTTTKPSQKLRKAYEAVLTAQKRAIAAIKPDEIMENVDRVARKSLEDAGFGKLFTHGLGHGIGLQVHEGKRFCPGSKTALQPGMVMTVEPGVYMSGWGGIRIEDDVLITKDGCEVLSSTLAKEFEEMIVT